ncbi:hypothetical protein Lal_00037781 [Lupinus albus]|nr:hypothetical protein Lal_00037781 [Lupinus albus]
MQLETIFHMQREMSNTEYLDDQDAEEPDDFIISLTAQINRRDDEMAPFISNAKRNYIFGGICGVAAHASIKALMDMKSINLFGVQQTCRNTIALEQALSAIPSINNEAVQQRLDRVRTYYELLNMPFEASPLNWPCLPSLQNICTYLPLLSMPTFLAFRSPEERFLLMHRIEYLKYYPFSVFILLFLSQSLFWTPEMLASYRILILISDQRRCNKPMQMSNL